MDKEEYRQKLDELTGYVKDKDFENALDLADQIDWRRVKSLNTLNMAADVYEVNKDYEKARQVLEIALSRATIGHSILYRLVEVCLKLGDTDAAERYFNEFSRTARNDNSRCILQYKLYKAKNAPLEAQIDVLEEYREKEYTERWAYELALLYSKAGDRKKCVDACDDLILWFGEGKYVLKAMELKKQYEPLSPSQEQAYEKMLKSYRLPENDKDEASADASDTDEDSASEQDASDRAGAYTAREAEEDIENHSDADDRIQAEDAGKEKRRPDEGDLKERISRNFRNIFGSQNNEDSSSDEQKVTEDSTGSGASSEPDTEKKSSDKFDLNAFLAETAGTFSDEIHKNGDEIKKDAEEKSVSQKDAETESPEEAAVNASVDGASPKPPVRMSAADALAGLTADIPKNLGSNDASDLVSGKAQKAEEAENDEQSAEVSEKSGSEDAVSSENQNDQDDSKAFGTDPNRNAQDNTPAAQTDETAAEKKKPHYIEELEVPDPEPTEEEKKAHTHTIPLDTIGENTVPISIDKILKEETPEERRIRILNKAKPNRMSEEQRKIFTYFARIPGMDGQILEAINGVYQHAGERTSLHGNIAIMGARGTGKSRLAHGLIVAMCKDLGMDAAKVARIGGKAMNKRDPAKVVSMMAGGFLVIEDVADINEDTLQKLNKAMEFRTDCMVLIIEDEKTRMRTFLKEHPQFAGKFEKVISIPVFTNDELVTFARTYATENGCKIDDMAILALYTMIGNIQSEEEPTTISTVKSIIDSAIAKASKGRKRRTKGDEAEKTGKWLVLHEKDFNV